MSLVASTIPNLVSGVSQQPAPSRLSTSGEDMVNAFPSVVSGLIKRPPTEFIQELSPAMNVSDTAAVHMINRDANEKYILVCGDGDLELYDELGNQQTVTFPDGKDYLPTSDIWRKLKFVSVADTTFVLNTDKVVSSSPKEETRIDPNIQASVFVKKAVASVRYAIYVNGLKVGDMVTSSNTSASTALEGTSEIAEQLRASLDVAGDTPARLEYSGGASGFILQAVQGGTAGNNISLRVLNGSGEGAAAGCYVNGNDITVTGSTGFNGGNTTRALDVVNAINNNPDASALVNAFLPSGYYGNGFVAPLPVPKTFLSGGLDTAIVGDVRAVGPVVTFIVPSGASVTVLDEFGGNSMEVYTSKIQSFDRLPPMEQFTRMVEVVGDLEVDAPSFWVQYSSDHVWEECAGFNAQRQLDPETMPHILVKTGPGTFEFRRNDWKDRLVGDDDSNPDPSFVGKTINNMFLFKGRLGFLAGENVIMSESALLESFYRTTVVQLLSSDLIDIASTTGRVSTLYHATSFSDELILFSDKQQFRLSSGNVLSPESVGITNSTGYPCSTLVAPVTVGSSAYFLSPGATHSIAREIFIDGDRRTVSGEDIAVQVPSYIPLNIRGLAASEASDVFLALSEENPNELYVYKWYITGREKIQSAWSKWVFDENVSIVGMGFLEEYLYLVYKVGSDVRIDRVLVGPIIDKNLLLDHQCDKADFSAIFYSNTNDETTIVLPYGTPSTVEFYRTDANAFAPYENVTKVSENTYVIPGDVTGDQITAGINYEFLYEFSHQYLREKSQNGESAIQDGRLQLRYFSVIYTDTSYVEAVVTPKGGDPRTTVFNGRILADPDNSADLIPKDTGEFQFPVFAKNDEVQIQLRSNFPYRCALGAVEWSAVYKQKAKRV